MCNLARLLHRLLVFPFSSSVAPFSTSNSTPSFASQVKPLPPDSPAERTEENPGEASTSATEEVGAALQREKLPSELPRPSTITFKRRVANTIHLVGTVSAPVQLQRLPDGRFSAVSVLVQDSRADFPKFRIPVIFQDDLAQIAAFHLQENDLVYVSGQLTGDAPPIERADGQANIQVLAHLLSFVESEAVATDARVLEEERCREIAVDRKKVKQTEVISKYPRGQTFSEFKAQQNKVKELWNDVLANPHDWTDNRAANANKNPKCPDFKNRKSEEALWLNSASKSVLEKLDSVTFKSSYHATKPGCWGKLKTGQSASDQIRKKEEALWKNLLDNYENWSDNRINKMSPTDPDFTHTLTGEGLWLKNPNAKTGVRQCEEGSTNSGAVE